MWFFAPTKNHKPAHHIGGSDSKEMFCKPWPSAWSHMERNTSCAAYHSMRPSTSLHTWKLRPPQRSGSTLGAPRQCAPACPQSADAACASADASENRSAGPPPAGSTSRRLAPPSCSATSHWTPNIAGASAPGSEAMHSTKTGPAALPPGETDPGSAANGPPSRPSASCHGSRVSHGAGAEGACSGPATACSGGTVTALRRRAASVTALCAAARARAGHREVASASMSNPSRTAAPGCGPDALGWCGGGQPSRVTGSTRRSAATRAHTTQAAMRPPGSPTAACANNAFQSQVSAFQQCPWKHSATRNTLACIHAAACQQAFVTLIPW